MPTTDERTIALCLEIADRLRAVAADEGEDLTPEERRALVEVAAEVAAEVERRARRVRRPA